MKRLLCAAIATVSLFVAGCGSENLSVDTPETGLGAVTVIESEMAQAAAIYTDPKANAGDLRYGSLKLLKVTLDKNPYLVDWNDEGIYKGLKVGDKITFRGNGQYVHVKRPGGNDAYRVVRLIQ